MPIKFTKHALERIKSRSINITEIIDTLKNPDKLIVDKSGINIAQKKVKNQLLRVFYNEEKKTKKVITAYKVSNYNRYI
ncbi:MAG: DUF4258 domain-containing protein [Promethearchaeota archaeon]